MNASEARLLMDKAPMSPQDIKQRKNIEGKIKIAASNGEEMIWWYDKMSHKLLTALQEDGFNIVDQSDRDGTLISISWKA